MSYLADTTTLGASGAATVLVPVGSLEQHGPHLPLDTDSVIAEAVAILAAEHMPRTWVAPVIAYGSSGEHQSFAGTTSIGTDVLELVLVELARSLRTWVTRVVFVNGHGGNVTALNSAVVRLLDEGHLVSWIACETEAVDLHAGRTETSLMLHLRPHLVRLELAKAGNTQPLREILPIMVEYGVGAVSANGVLGDPSGASGAEGRAILEAMADQVVRTVLQGVS